MHLIRILNEEDAIIYRSLRLYALKESPTSFGSTSNEESFLPISWFSQRLSKNSQENHSFIFGGFNKRKQLVALAGLHRYTAMNIKHKALVWGVYVHPDFRGTGLSKELLKFLINQAKNLVTLEQLLLTVVSTNHEAYSLYDKFGFKIFGCEPQALKTETNYLDEYHMILKLK
jgi:RimJ/RimL family protein N-acetyltransferase